MTEEVDAAHTKNLQFDCALRDPRLISEAMQYYRLVAVWLMRVVATNGAYG